MKVEEDDVKLVVAQTGCSEEKARDALKAENGDLINASESESESVWNEQGVGKWDGGSGSGLWSWVALGLQTP